MMLLYQGLTYIKTELKSCYLTAKSVVMLLLTDKIRGRPFQALLDQTCREPISGTGILAGTDA